MAEIQPTVARFRNQRSAVPIDYGPMLEMTATAMQNMRDEIVADVLAELRDELAELRGRMGVADQIAAVLSRLSSPVVNVAPPSVNVAAPRVDVEAPEVTVNVPPISSDIKLLPPPPNGQKSIQIQRDARGAITGAIVKEH